MPSSTVNITITHLGRLSVGYSFSNGKYDSNRPTVVCINSMCMTAELYEPQMSDDRVTDVANILAIEPLGHGSTTFPSKAAQFTYWDTAIMALEAMTALGIEKAFALGTSQGGWMVARMALLAPERILGLILLGTSMDAETPDSRSKGCWDPMPILKPFSDAWGGEFTDWVVDDTWCGMVGSFGFGSHATEELSSHWYKILKTVYRGDEGKKKARMSVICLLERDGLLLRLGDIQCPVRWLHGDKDDVYSTMIASEQVKMFKNAHLSIVEGGAHYLNATNPKEVNSAILEMLHHSE